MIKKILVLILSIGFCLSLISKIVAEEKISGFIFWKTKRVGKDSKGNKIVKYYYKSKTSNLKIKISLTI